MFAGQAIGFGSPSKQAAQARRKLVRRRLVCRVRLRHRSCAFVIVLACVAGCAHARTKRVQKETRSRRRYPGARCDHDQPVESQRDTRAIRQTGSQRRKEQRRRNRALAGPARVARHSLPRTGRVARPPRRVRESRWPVRAGPRTLRNARPRARRCARAPPGWRGNRMHETEPIRRERVCHECRHRKVQQVIARCVRAHRIGQRKAFAFDRCGNRGRRRGQAGRHPRPRSNAAW